MFNIADQKAESFRRSLMRRWISEQNMLLHLGIHNPIPSSNLPGTFLRPPTSSPVETTFLSIRNVPFPSTRQWTRHLAESRRNLRQLYEESVETSDEVPNDARSRSAISLSSSQSPKSMSSNPSPIDLTCGRSSARNAPNALASGSAPSRSTSTFSNRRQQEESVVPNFAHPLTWYRPQYQRSADRHGRSTAGHDPTSSTAGHDPTRSTADHALARSTANHGYYPSNAGLDFNRAFASGSNFIQQASGANLSSSSTDYSASGYDADYSSENQTSIRPIVIQSSTSGYGPNHSSMQQTCTSPIVSFDPSQSTNIPDPGYSLQYPDPGYSLLHHPGYLILNHPDYSAVNPNPGYSTLNPDPGYSTLNPDPSYQLSRNPSQYVASNQPSVHPIRDRKPSENIEHAQSETTVQRYNLDATRAYVLNPSAQIFVPQNTYILTPSSSSNVPAIPESGNVSLSELDPIPVSETNNAIVPQAEYAPVTETDNTYVPEDEYVPVSETDNAVVPVAEYISESESFRFFEQEAENVTDSKIERALELEAECGSVFEAGELSLLDVSSFHISDVDNVPGSEADESHAEEPSPS